MTARRAAGRPAGPRHGRKLQGDPQGPAAVISENPSSPSHWSQAQSKSKEKATTPRVQAMALSSGVKLSTTASSCWAGSCLLLFRGVSVECLPGNRSRDAGTGSKPSKPVAVCFPVCKYLRFQGKRGIVGTRFAFDPALFSPPPFFFFQNTQGWSLTLTCHGEPTVALCCVQ